jgi:hypothetical protein
VIIIPGVDGLDSRHPVLGSSALKITNDTFKGQEIEMASV